VKERANGRSVAAGRERVRRATAASVAAVVAAAFLSHALIDRGLIERGLTAMAPLALGLERARRRAYAALGQPLPGTPDLANLSGRLAAHGLRLGAPVFVRIFKREFELELWMQRGDRFERFATYPICRWSGNLGPKLQEGDQQAPEGFYTVTAKALNAASRWHRAFDLGYPNAFDRANGRTGSLLMVHGGCASVGCFAMTDPVIDELWRLITAALNGGQTRFHVHVFPFRMTPENLANPQIARWGGFWRDLERGYAAFEATHLPPAIAVCAGRYIVAHSADSRAGGHEIANSCMNLTGDKG
jgi:murein L,D-transpeptidase YafK